MDKVRPNQFVPMFNSAGALKGESPSSNACCSARALAKIGACVINGGAMDGVRILSTDAIEAMHGDFKKSLNRGIGMSTEFSQGGVNLYRYSKLSIYVVKLSI